MHRLLLGLLIAGCTGSATVTSGPGPAHPAPPPPPPGPGPTVVVAPPASHPAYHRALADLRNAALYLRRPSNAQVAWDEKKALNEINIAMEEMRRAAIEDDKSASDAGPADTMVWGDRLHRALELCEAARRDINQEEDDRYANGLKKRALMRIDAAVKHINDGIVDSTAHAPPPPPPAQHPAYLHALTDLREARYLLEKPAKPLVKWDENAAVREIDAAINEIKGAAIDDGKNLNDHPAADAGWDHKARLHRAMELLQQSMRDIEQKEDNGFAKGLRNRAVQHIGAAERFVREAIEDKKGGKKR